MSYELFTDSCCDMPNEHYQENGIHLFSFDFSIGGETFTDNMATQRDYRDFSQRVRSGEMPITAQINAYRFVAAFEPILSQGKDVLYIGVSSALSGTYNSAQLACNDLRKEFPERQIAVIDSVSASMGQGLLVYQAAQLKRQGKSLEEVARWVEENKCNVHHWFTVDDLHCLHRGGRVSSASAMTGTILGIKPVLHVDNKGRLIPQSIIRGRKKALKTLVDRMESLAVDIGKTPIFITHGDCVNDALALVDMIQERFGVIVAMINFIGPVIGTHYGPGTVALFFMGKNRETKLSQ